MFRIIFFIHFLVLQLLFLILEKTKTDKHLTSYPVNSNLVAFTIFWFPHFNFMEAH
jgi:hypothetical protein